MIFKYQLNRIDRIQQMSQQLKQKSPQKQSQGQQEGPQKNTREIQLSTIVHEKDNDQPIAQQIPKRISRVQPPTIKNPIRYYKGNEQYHWKLNQINPVQLIDQLVVQPVEFTEELPFQNDLRVVESELVSAGFVKHRYYVVERRDKNGEGKFSRRYTEYISFRKKLVELWPVIFIPVLPNKSFLGSSDEDILRSRTKYINHFWRKLIANQEIYYSQQVQLFINSTEQVNIEATFDKLQIPKIEVLLQKYKNNFSEAYQTSIKQQFMYRKQQAPVILDEFQTYFSSKRKDLSQFKEVIKRLAESKKKYIRAMAKLNMAVLPDYQDTMLRWINGMPLGQEEQKKGPARQSLQVVEKPSSKEEHAEGEAARQQKKEQKAQQKVDYKMEADEIVIKQPYQCLYNSQAYKSQLQDLQSQLKHFNHSNWLLYDVIKFELKDIDMVLLALEKIKLIRRQIQFLTRNIAANKDQIQSLNNKKTSLKIFFMGGSEDDKKAKLTMQNQYFQQNLERFQEFYLILLALVEKQLITYHKERVEYYQRAIKKIVVDEIGIAKAILQTHLYQVQIFSKIYTQKIRQIETSSLRDQQQIQIKQ